MTDAERLLEAVEKKSEPHLRAIRKRIEDGTATFADTAEYSRILSELLGRELSAEVLGLTDREGTAEALLRESYNDTNEVCAQVQTALDEKKGLHLAPQKAPFPAERVAQFAHSLVDPTVPDEKIQRRAKSGTENISMSFHDDFIEQNAEFRERAGLKCYVTRTSSGSCCPWCTAVAGKYLMSEQPEGLFRRHDNCDCVIVYDGQVLRGQKGENGRRNKKWVEDKAARIEFAESVPKPVVLSRSEAERLQAELLPKRLTGVADSAIIEFRENADLYHQVTKESIENVPDMNLFGKDDAKNAAHRQASKDLLSEVARHPELKVGTEFSIVYDADMKPIEGFGYVQGEVGRTKIDNPGVPYHAFHNHGSNETFSFKDLQGFASKENMISLTVQGNLGNKYVIMSEKNLDKKIYSYYLKNHASDVLYEYNGVKFNIVNVYTDEMKAIVSQMPDSQKEELINAVRLKTEECIKGGQRYGIKYFKA